MPSLTSPSGPDHRRRRLLGALGAGTLAPWATLSLAATGAATPNRFVFVILRGGLDGLACVPAPGDPDFAPARGPLAQFASAPLPLDPTFALHPNLAQLHAMYGRGELAVVHAVGLPYRDRSHFDAQQVLESGGARPYEISSGWLGRTLGSSGAKGMALNTAVPLVLRGPATVDTWAPSALPDPSADLVTRIERMYANDRTLASALERAKALHFDSTMAADAAGGAGNGRAGGFVVLAQRAAEHEGRDLRITTDLRSVLKGALADHLKIAQHSLNTEVFPGSASVKGISLLRA